MDGLAVLTALISAVAGHLLFLVHSDIAVRVGGVNLAVCYLLPCLVDDLFDGHGQILAVAT